MLDKLRSRMREPLYSLRMFMQRGRKGYAEVDLWNMDSYLSKVIAGAFREWADVSMSHPDGITHEEWQGILRDIAASFDAYIASREANELVEPNWELFTHWWGHFWD